MPKCPDCDRLTHLTRRGPTRYNWAALASIGAVPVYAALMWPRFVIAVFLLFVAYALADWLRL